MSQRNGDKARYDREQYKDTSAEARSRIAESTDSNC